MSVGKGVQGKVIASPEFKIYSTTFFSLQKEKKIFVLSVFKT